MFREGGMPFSEIEEVVDGMMSKLKGDGSLFESAETEKAKFLESGIKSYGEYREGVRIESDHTPYRLAVFLLNYYGETATAGRTVTIYDDDPYPGKAAHRNSYRLNLKDEYSHISLLPSNPEAKDEPYDFYGTFSRQITTYADGNEVDTTKTAWDSFAKRYQPPWRTFDFKSALWKGNGHLHGVNYTVTIDEGGNYVVRDPGFRIKKAFMSPADTELQKECMEKYGRLLKEMEILKGHT